MNWHYSQNGQQLGPIPQDELQAKLDSGEVAPQTLVWSDGLPNWVSAEQSGAFTLPLVATGSSTSTAATAVSSSPSPYVAPNASWSGTPQSTGSETGLALASMICGIVSIVLGLNVIAGVPAVIMGHMALKKQRATSSTEGKAFAITGLITGYISIAIALIVVLIFVLFIGGGLAAAAASAASAS